MWVTFQRPEFHNALNRETFQALDQARRDFEANSHLQIMILQGRGKAFGAGSDLKELEALTQEQALARVQSHQKILDDFEKCPKPILAAMHGYALGAGLELALCCHLRLASENTQLGFPEITLGLFPALGGIRRLQKAVGQSLATDMVLTGRRLSAQEALTAGLISRVSSQEGFAAASQDFALDVARHKPKAITCAIHCLHGAPAQSEALAFAERLSSQDVQETLKQRIWKGLKHSQPESL